MNIALVAHDNCKKDLVRWAREHVNELKGHRLTCTGTTGRLIDAALRELLGDESPSTPVECLKSGPLGGDRSCTGVKRRGGRNGTCRLPIGCGADARAWTAIPRWRIERVCFRS